MYSIWLSKCGADSGKTTCLMSCPFEIPIELIASTGSASIASIDSYCNFAINPTVYMIIARTPAKGQLIRHVVLPESAPHLLSQMLYMFDYNVRQTSILGLVGAGGIGFYIINYIKFFEYGKAAVFMLVVLITVLIIDYVSVKIRDHYIVKSQKGLEVKA